MRHIVLFGETRLNTQIKEKSMDKLKKEVERTLKDCMDAIPEYELSTEGGNYINEGWIEALEYVLNHIKMNEEEEE